MSNSKDIQKELKSNHKTVLSDSSITKKLKDKGYLYSAPTQWLKLSKAQMEPGEKWMKDSSLVNWNNAIYIDEKVFYGRDVTHKNVYLQVKSIQSKEQELTLNAMCLAWFTSQEFQLLNCLKEVSTVINF